MAALALMTLTACDDPPPFVPTPPGPTVACPDSIDVQSPDDNPVIVSYSAATVTGGIAPVTVQCSTASEAEFPIGTTPVTCTATDAQARSSSCTFNVHVRPAPRLSATQFLAFGDSITYGVDSPPVSTLAPPYSYPFQLRDMMAAGYPRQTFSMVNSGVPGEYASRRHADGGPSGRQRLGRELMATNPEVLLLMEGTNDLLDVQDGAADAIQALESMVQDAKGRGVRVFLATIPPQRLGGRRDRVARSIPGFNDRLRVLAEQQGVVLVDIYAAMEPDIQNLIGRDDLHPTLLGFDVMARTFFTAIETHLQASPPSPSPPPAEKHGR